MRKYINLAFFKNRFTEATAKETKRSTDTTIPDCLNCGYLLPDDANLCPSCGQKRTTGRVRLWDVLLEWFDSTFSIDARLLWTLLFLFNPGKLTNEYFAGRHIRYWTPLRLFLLTAAIYLGYASSVANEKGVNGFWQAVTQNYDSVAGAKYKAYKELDSLKIEVSKKFKNQKTALAAQDTLLNWWWQNASKRTITWSDKAEKFSTDSLDEDNIKSKEDSILSQPKITKQLDTLFGNSIDSIELPNINNIQVRRIAKKDFYELSPDALIERYKVQGWWNKMTTRQSLKMMKGGSNFGDSFVARISWALLFLMPILAFWLKLLYIRDRRYYVEHLIFSFHIHAFVFVMLSLALFLTHYCKMQGNIEKGAVIACFFYIGVALKNVYHQGWLKTILKYILLLLAYILMTFIVFLFTLVINFYLF
jgi:hypothetical protein